MQNDEIENATFDVKFDKSGKYVMSLIIGENSYTVKEFYIINNNYFFIINQYSSITLKRAIKGKYIDDNNIHILSLPIALLKQFRCMK